TAIGAGLQLAVDSLPGRGDGEQTLGKLPPVAIVLLSDGRNNRPPFNVLEIAGHARDAQVKVYTVGLGTAGGFLSPGRDGIGGFEVGFDGETLRAIAQITGGQYFQAQSAGQLSAVYQGLGRDVAWTPKPRDVTAGAAGVAGVLLLLSLLASSWERRLL
ncbi:MAG TPA: VWA domain-containing protein, partial [Deinococcales bacterium]|nr:VWA domain-containing protein [Deinococcales bacterium]